MKSKEFLGNLIKFCVPSVFSAIVGICILPLVSRIYPEAEYGYISNFYSIGNLLMGVVLLGLDSAYIRYFNIPPTGASQNGLFTFALQIGLTVTIVIFSGVLIIAPDVISAYLFNDIQIIGISLLGIYVVELVVYRLYNINLRFSENSKGYNFQQISFILGNRLLFVLGTLISKDYVYSIAIMVFTTFVIIVVSALYQRDVFNNIQINNSAKKEVIRFALPMMPATIVVFLNNSVSKLILGASGMHDEVGVLALATSAANVFSVIPAAFTTYWGAFMYKYYETEKERIKRIHDVIVLFSIIMVWAIIAMQDVIYLLLGFNYRGSQAYFMMIMLSPVTTLLSETTTYGISIAKKTKYVLYTVVLGCVINVAACYMLIPMYGALGAAIGIVASATICFVMRTFIAQKYYISISSKRRTFTGCIILWALCIGNIILYNHLILRFAVCSIVLLIVVMLYRKLIIQMWNSLFAVKANKV